MEKVNIIGSSDVIVLVNLYLEFEPARIIPGNPFSFLDGFLHWFPTKGLRLLAYLNLVKGDVCGCLTLYVTGQERNTRLLEESRCRTKSGLTYFIISIALVGAKKSLSVRERKNKYFAFVGVACGMPVTIQRKRDDFRGFRF